MSDHSLHSPSRLAADMLCPGRWRMEIGREEGDKTYAVDGTHSHYLLETCLKDNATSATQYVGQELTDHEGTFTVDEERAERVNVALDYILREKQERKPCTVRSEERVDAGSLIGRSDISGTSDVMLVSHTMLEVIDYKDGHGEVTPENNAQLMAYGAGALQQYLVDGQIPFETVRLTIIQPKTEPAIKSWDVQPMRLVDWVMNEVKPALARCDDPTAPLVPGDVQCKWCLAKGDCPALAEKALSVAQAAFAEVEVVEQVSDLSPTRLTDQQLREVIEAAPLVSGFIDGAFAEAKRRIETGQQIEGLKLVRNAGRRQWRLTDEETDEKLQRMGVPKSERWVTKFISPAQLEKLKWKNRKGDVKQLTARQLKRVRDDLVSKTEGSITVALATDSRPEVVTDATRMFANVTPEKPVEDEIPDWLKL